MCAGEKYASLTYAVPVGWATTWSFRAYVKTPQPVKATGSSGKNSSTHCKTPEL